METLIEIGKQVPALTVLVILVWLFLRAQADSRGEFLDTMRTIQEENLEARLLSRDVIKENTNVSKETNMLLAKLSDAVKDIDKRLLK